MADLSFVPAILGDDVVMEFSEQGVFSTDDQKAWLLRILSEKTQDDLPGHLAVERKEDRFILGYVSLSHDPDRNSADDAELGFRLARYAWNQGYATEATRALIDAETIHGRTRRIVAIVDPNNHRSVRVLKKLEMAFERDILFEGYDHPDHLFVRHLATDAASASHALPEDRL
ncbi:MAG: GNAT family N-acetyltransferase [Pseudomonadota bacterium]